MTLRLRDTFGMVPVGEKRAASPLDVRKSSAFPASPTQESGSAADPRHSLEDRLEDQPAKQNFAAHRQAEPEKPVGGFYRVGCADAGIDGLMVFSDDYSGKAEKIVVSVKRGHVNVAQIRDLAHVVARENAAIGAFLTLEEPTKPMLLQAVNEGFYHMWQMASSLEFGWLYLSFSGPIISIVGLGTS